MSQSVMKAKRIPIQELEEWKSSQWRQWIIERKIDGFRFSRVNGKWSSKQGKEFFNTEEIKKVLSSCKKLNGYIIDGELAGKTWQQTMTLFRSSKADVSKKLDDGKYWVFDIVHPDRLNEEWRDRSERLLEAFDQIDHPSIRVVPSHSLQEFEDFEERHRRNLEIGCDGSILKYRFGGYEFKRSKLWLKVKPIKEMDCKIVGFKKGKGKYQNTLGSILVRIPLPKNKWSEKTTAVSGMTDEDRNYIWKNRDELIGVIAEVKYRIVSDQDRLIEGRLHRLRLDKRKEIE